MYELLNPDETLDFFEKLNKLPESEYAERKVYLFEKLGINDFRKKRVGQMSTGMKQKISIAAIYFSYKKFSDESAILS